MRYATVVLDPSDDHHTFDDLRHVRMDDDVVATYEAIYDLNPLDDGTVVGLVQLTGDVERLARTVSDHSGVASMVTSRSTGLVYVHFEPGEHNKALFDIIGTHQINVDWPVLYTEQGFQLTLIGEDTDLQQVTADLSETVEMTIEKTGTYYPRMLDPAWHLTDRQYEIVRVAITEGYYDIPRETSQRDLAAQLDLSRATVAEHLRKAEATVMREVMK